MCVFPQSQLDDVWFFAERKERSDFRAALHYYALTPAYWSYLRINTLKFLRLIHTRTLKLLGQKFSLKKLAKSPFYERDTGWHKKNGQSTILYYFRGLFFFLAPCKIPQIISFNHFFFC